MRETVLLFADGLRFDLAHRLVERLGAANRYDLAWRFGPLPGVTPTAKPAVSPIAEHLFPGPGFDAALQPGGPRLTAEGMRKAMIAAGWQVLAGNETGDPTGRAWTEAGSIDSYGHAQGWKLARHVEGEIATIARRVEELLAAGWARVVVLTDHGWLLLPDGLPKAELPEHLTVIRKGRCARLTPDARTDEPVVPWHWDPAVRVVVARGIACYEAGKEYEHGGISPQECVLPVLTVSAMASPARAAIAGVVWRGLRCVVTVDGGAPGMTVDLRTRAADPGASIAAAAKAVGDGGTASLVVEDEEREGEAAHVVVLGPDGSVVAQTTTTVGG